MPTASEPSKTADTGNSVQSVVTNLETLGAQVHALTEAIQSSFKAKFGDLGADAVAAADAAEVITEAAIFVLGSSTGLTEALSIEKLIVMLAPEAVPALELIASFVSGWHFEIHPAIPGNSPENGGYPNQGGRQHGSPA